MKHKILYAVFFMTASGLLFTSCDKKDKTALVNYPKDSNPPGGPLKFYTAFEGTSTDLLMNAVDSIRANFPSDNPLASTAGISGKAVQGANKKFIKYSKPNDWATTAKSFSISFWYKRDGQTKNNAGTNGPEYIMSFKSSNGHWSGASTLVFLEGNNAACAVKIMMVDATGADNWFTWEGGNTIAGIMNNAWQHIVITYDAAASTMKLFVNGAANANVRTWGTHGAINIDNAAISEMRIGAGPGTSYDTDDWLSSSFKGQIDQFRMYGTALSATEISSLFTSKL